MSITTKLKVIESVEAFLATFKIDDKFWYVPSELGKPSFVGGPQIIVHQDPHGYIVYARNNKDGNQQWYLNDLVNEWNAAFLAPEDAQAYFEGKMNVYKTDPELIAEHEQDEWDLEADDEARQKAEQDERRRETEPEDAESVLYPE